jgi:hypothetical protein
MGLKKSHGHEKITQKYFAWPVPTHGMALGYKSGEEGGNILSAISNCNPIFKNNTFTYRTKTFLEN